VSIGIVSPTSNERFEAGDAISFVIEVSGAVSSCFFFFPARLRTNEPYPQDFAQEALFMNKHAYVH
jgi:hypothetical protein